MAKNFESGRYTKTAEAIFKLLPSSENADDLTFEEAVAIGKKIFPGCLPVPIDAVDHRQHWAVMLGLWAAAGRGFYINGFNKLPLWLRICIVAKTPNQNRPVTHDEKIKRICEEIQTIDDPVRLAKGWLWLACGYTESEVICIQMDHEAREDLSELSVEVEDNLAERLKKMEEM